jgi:hypothetical protein
MATIAKDNIIVEIITKGKEKSDRDIKSVKKGIGGLETVLKRGAAALAGFFTIQEFNKLAVQLDSLNKKANIVFGDTLPQITKSAEDNARAMGLTTAEYVSAAAAAQDLLVPMGFTRQEATDLSVQLTNLSGALSSWTNGQISSVQVSEILNKALLGEREQLKALGISISENDLKNELARKGLDKLTGSTLKQARAATTLELITRKSADAQTAFANGSESLSIKQAKLAATLREIRDIVAVVLIPVFERLTSAIDTDRLEFALKRTIAFFAGLISGIIQFFKNLKTGFEQTLLNIRQGVINLRDFLGQDTSADQLLLDADKLELRLRKDGRTLAEAFNEAFDEVMDAKIINDTVVNGFAGAVPAVEKEIKKVKEQLIDGSIAQLEKTISELQEKISKSPPDPKVLAGLIQQLVAAQGELERLEKQIDAIQFSISIREGTGLEGIFKDLFGEVDEKATENRIQELSKKGLEAALEAAKKAKDFDDKEIESEKTKAEKIKEIRKDLADSLKTLALDVLQFQIEQKDAEIAAQEQRVSKFQSLAEKGTAEQLELEEVRLAKLTEEREKFVQRQRALSALEIATSTAVSIAKFVESIAKASADAPIIGTVLQGVAIAATVVSTILAVKNALSNIPAFRTGIEDTSTVRGGNNESGFLSILHPSERVLTKEQNAPLLRAGIKNEDIPMLAILGKQRMQSPRIKHDLIYKQLTRGEGSNNEALLSEMKGIRKRLDKMEMSFSVTEKGIHAAFMKYQNRESKRKAAIS